MTPAVTLMLALVVAVVVLAAAIAGRPSQNPPRDLRDLDWWEDQ